jgi:integrase
VSRADEVYNYSRTLKREISTLNSNTLCKENREAILQYHKQLIADRLGIARQIKYLQTLRYISGILNKPFSQLTKKDMINFVAEIEQRDYSDWTKRDYKMVMKRFYKWYRSWEDGYPPEVKWIKLRTNIQNKLQKKDLLTVEDIEKLAESANNLRDKAFIWVYFESMRRLGEIMTLNVGDVEFDELGARLRVIGKVGRGTGRIVYSSQLLANWLSVHPLKDDPDAPLWVTLDSNKNVRRISYPAIRKMIEECKERAGIKKKVWPYLIRHSRITPASKILPHALLCSTAGWRQGSKMPQVYIHLGGEDVDEAHRILNKIDSEVKEKKQNEAIICKRCFNKNIPGSKFCGRCGFPIDVKAALELEDKRKKADELMSQIVKRPEVMEAIIKVVDELSS